MSLSYNTLSKPPKGLRPLLNNGDFFLGTQRRIFCIFELEKFAAVHKKNSSGDLSSWLEVERVGFHKIRQKLGPIFLKLEWGSGSKKVGSFHLFSCCWSRLRCDFTKIGLFSRFVFLFGEGQDARVRLHRDGAAG